MKNQLDYINNWQNDFNKNNTKVIEDLKIELENKINTYNISNSINGGRMLNSSERGNLFNNEISKKLDNLQNEVIKQQKNIDLIL